MSVIINICNFIDYKYKKFNLNSKIHLRCIVRIGMNNFFIIMNFDFHALATNML